MTQNGFKQNKRDLIENLIPPLNLLYRRTILRSLGVRIGHRATLYTSGEHVDMNFNSYLVHVNIPCKDG